jgi:hypothetical protein
MKQPVRSLLLLLLVAATVVSCKNKTPREAKYIPREASFVMAVDPEQMQDKLQKGGINMDTLLKRVFKNDSLDAKDKAHFMELKDNAGIKWSEKLFLFMVQKTNPDNSQSNTFSALGSLDNAAKLEAFLKKQDFLKGKEIKKEKDYSYITNGDNIMIAWNSEQVITSFYSHTAKPVYDTVAMTFKQPLPENTEAEEKKQVDRYFTQKINESLADVEIFTSMFKEKADGYAFTSGNSALSALNTMPLQLPKLEELLKDNYTTSTLSFDDGKIVAKTTSYTNELLSSVLKKYAGPTVNLSLIEHYPSQNINGIVMAAFNPEIFGGILKQLEVEGLANNFLEKAGFTTQDLYKSLKGDIAVVVSDIGTAPPADPTGKTDERNMMRNKPLGKMILMAPVGDKASFTKIMDKGVEMGILIKKDKTYKAGGLVSMLGVFIVADDKNLIVASDSITYTQYIANSSKAAISKETLDRFNGKSTVFYIDIAKTLNGFITDSSASYNTSLRSAKATFKDLLATSDNFDGKSLKAVFEIRMQNEKQNSLVTLTSLVTDIAVDMRLKARKEKEAEDKFFPGGVPAIIRTN